MDENEQRNDEQASRPPARSDCSTLSLRAAADFDRMLAALNAVMIAGLLALLLREPLPTAAGALLFLALACLSASCGHTLRHVRATANLLATVGMLENRAARAPDGGRREEPELDDFAQLDDAVLKSSLSQVIFFAVGVGLAALGLTIHLWHYAWRAGAVALSLFVLLAVVTGLVAAFKKVRRKRTPAAAPANGKAHATPKT